MEEMNIMANAMRNFGVSVQEAAKAVQDFGRLIPPFTKEDIELVKMNPSLSIVAKIRIIRSMKKQMVPEQR